MDLSIIIPVYNVEVFVGICLRSIINGNDAPSSSFELIVVNDGTQDNSMAIVNEVCSGLENVHIINQENQGLSAARMAGLSIAKGDYVWFIDSDDWLEPNAILSVLNYIKKYQASVFILPLQWRYSDSNNDYPDISIDEPKLITGREYLKDYGYPPWAVQRYIIKHSIIDREWLYFPLRRLHEDEYFGRVLMYYAERVLVINDCLYNYRQRGNSIMSNISIRSSYDIVEIHKLLCSFTKAVVIKSDQGWFRRKNFNEVLMNCYYRNVSIIGTIIFARFLREHQLYILFQYFKIASFIRIKKTIGDLWFIVFPVSYIKRRGVRFL